ncbi:xerD [Symbiodinium necroappetens]|uniref:XerD protein n=1 Tax=Symbiodinium necroappetens TaxID=1628268 RepID=A0A812SAR8_9DINO|nr:xerD [Symbiodinium necroappetens]
MARLLNKQLHDHVTKEKRHDHRKTAGPTDAPAADQGDVPSQGAEGVTAVQAKTDEAHQRKAAYDKLLASKRLAPCGGPTIPLVEGQDVPEFAVKLAGLIILSLAMPFGWVGSPGEFVAWSAAAKAHHGSFRPMEPRFNDVVPFESKWLLDDGVVVEPMVGNRVLDSLAVLDETMQLVWGPEGVNVEKMAEEGEPSTTQLLWGLHMNFDLQEVEASGPEEEDRRWEDFWDALDFIRLQLASPPGLGSRVVTPRWNGLERKAQVFHAERVDQYREGLRGDWGGELVLYVTDNMNVKTGCQSPCPASPEAGWTEVDTSIHWEQFLQDAKRSALVYPTGEDPQGQTARSASGWRGNLCMLKTTQRDPTGRERKRLRQVLRGDSSRLQKLVVDCPRQFDIHWLEKLLVDYFPSIESCRYISSHLGAVTARRRALVFGWKDTTPPPTQLDRYRANPPPSMQMIPLDGIITTGDPWLRHLKGPGVPPKCLVHKTTCPACAFVGPTRDVKGIARAQGLTPAHWRELVDSLGQEEALGSRCLAIGKKIKARLEIVSTLRRSRRVSNWRSGWKPGPPGSATLNAQQENGWNFFLRLLTQLPRPSPHSGLTLGTPW